MGQRWYDRILARRQFVASRIFEKVGALSHRAFHLHDAVAHQAAETGWRLGAIDDLIDGCIEHAAKEKSRIVAAGTPLGGADPGDLLHVLNALAVPLIIEGRKMMRGAIPLTIHVFMAAFASLRLHEVFCRNRS